MSAVWNAVHGALKAAGLEHSPRITNLAIAAACSIKAGRKSGAMVVDATTLREAMKELALAPLPPLGRSSDQRWTRIAALAADASHLGASLDGMHSWAAAYQAATQTQKSLGAYATHSAFARALARITLEPMGDQVLRIIDPAVGCGNLLLAALAISRAEGARLRKQVLSMYGVELDPAARELCCLLLWLIARDCGVKLSEVADRISVANAITKEWLGMQPFDVLLMNPPWESLRHEVQGQTSERRETLARMESALPGAPGLPPLFSAQGTGDRNLFKAFVELAPHLIRDGGRLGALVPAAFASDAGMSELRLRYLQQFEIARWTSFENRGGYFPIDSRYKFGLLAATKSLRGTQKLFVRGFAVQPDEVDAPHILLTREDIFLVGRQYHIIPELSSAQEREVLVTALKAGVPLFEPRGSFGPVRYRREVDLTAGRKAGEFIHFSKNKLAVQGDGSFKDAKGNTFVPLLEGRLVGPYDCSQKSWESGSGRTAVWRDNGSSGFETCRPQYVMPPRQGGAARIALCDVTAATNTRTVLATWVPDSWTCGNTAPVLEFAEVGRAEAALGVLNSLTFDWIARRLTSGLHLNKFVLEGLVWPNLGDEDINRLRGLVYQVAARHPRSALAKVKPPSDAVYVSASAEIEVLVARGLRLGKRDLELMLANDRSDRRGFWRYFEAEPCALEIARRALEAI